MKRQPLDDARAREALAGLPGWELRGQRLCRAFRFASFGEAFAFMTRVALAAEALDHHPDWRNSYTLVEIELTTHDLGGLSTLDVELARRIDAIAPSATRG